MSTATGIHIAEQDLRRVTLERRGGRIVLTALSETPLSQPFSPEVLQEDRATLIAAIRQVLSGKQAAGRTALVLTGGLFHIQKVPLEVASEEDRREQITWEATQALIPPVEAYDIDFLPAGRVAYWTAVRKETASAFADLLAPFDVETAPPVVEPLALFAVGRLAGAARSGRTTTIHIAPPWLSYVATDEGTLTSAETMRTGDAQSPARTSAEQQIRQWLQGDLTADRRGAPLGRTFFCGPPEAVKAACQQFAHPQTPKPVELATFSRVDTAWLGKNSAHFLDRPGAFSVAAGAAFWLLDQTA